VHEGDQSALSKIENQSKETFRKPKTYLILKLIYIQKNCTNILQLSSTRTSNKKKTIFYVVSCSKTIS